MGWVYDGLGRVTSKSQTVGGTARTVGYGYTNGRLTSLTTPSGQAVAYSYTNGQITGITINGNAVLSGVVYEPFGPARSWTWGNSTTETRLHDTDGNPSLFTGAESTSYNLDSAFRIQGITNSNTPAASWTYGYDPLDRLTAGTSTASLISWTYDPNGNRQTQGGAAAPAYAVSALTFAYNNRGRMASVTASGQTTYVYNVLGQRIQKSGPGGTTVFVYDEAGHLLGEYTGAGALVQETVWLGDLPVLTIRPGAPVQLYYVHADHLGTPRTVTRSSDNAIVWRWDSDPFGVAPANSNPSGLGVFTYSLRYPGQYFDAETGLIYNYKRDFDPQTGRFVESDPIGLKAGWNTYAYVADKPVGFADPSGLSPCIMRGFRRSAWTEVAGSRGTPWYELIDVLASDATGIAVGCVWNRLQELKDRRDVYIIIDCWECRSTQCPTDSPRCAWKRREEKQGEEQRARTEVTRKVSSGVALMLGGDLDPESPSHWVCPSPGGGPPATGEFGP